MPKKSRKKLASNTHDGCPQFLRDKMAGLGCEVTVSTRPSLVVGPYTTDPYVCPHGVTYWIEPTGEQIADWVKRDAR